MAAYKNPISPPLPEQLFHELANTLEFDRFFCNAARAAGLAVNADYAGLIRRPGTPSRYEFFFALDPAGKQPPTPEILIANTDTVGRVLNLGQTLYATESAFVTPAPDIDLASHLVVPMRVAGRVEGALVLAWRHRPRRPPTRRRLRLVEALVAFMGNASYRSAVEAALTRDARCDPLTGLPNRSVLMDRLAHGCRRAGRNDHLLVIALLDVDSFKGINDELGHEAGDHLLTTVAGRLANSVRLADTVSRYGGDEFVILMEDITHLEQIEGMLDRMLFAIRQPIPFEGRFLSVTISVGLTIYPFDDQPPDVLLQHADQAMYEAKRAGGDRYRCFERANTALLAQRSQLRRDIETAISHNLWEPRYQPILDRAGRPAGIEVRLRWQRSDGTTVCEETASELVEASTRTGLLECLLAATRRDCLSYGRPPAPLHINIHAAELYDRRLPARLSDWRDEIYGAESGTIVVEVPDDVLASHPQAGARLALALEERGLRLIVDQYQAHKRADLAHIAATPLYGVKCDPVADARGSRLLRALSAGMNALGLAVYVDGIDTHPARTVVDAIGWDYGQGLAFAPELAAPALALWLKTGLPAL